ncbi:enoyl CoA hydratase domain-containing protein 1 [Chamberlinius hualienensis]
MIFRNSLCRLVTHLHVRRQGRVFYGKMDTSSPVSSSSTHVAEFEKELNRLGLLVGEGGGKIKLNKDQDKGLAIITLDNPNKRNAFDGSMILDLGRIVSDLESWVEGRGLILWGGSNFFCSGADLNMIQKLSPSGESGMKLANVMQHLLNRLLNLPLISVALITGKALGGGGELMTACDFRLMASDAEIQFLHQRMGLIPGWGGGTRLINIIGRASALDILTSCRRISAEEALRLGLADEVLSPSGSISLDEAKEWLLKRTQGEPEVVRAMKTMVAKTSGAKSFDEAMKLERDVFVDVWGGPAQLAALKKFLQKL